MKFVAIVTRTLKPGKTYEDYRKVWYHSVGFGVPTTMYTIVDAHDPRKIISFGLLDMDAFQLIKEFEIDIKERRSHPMDDVVESTIVRQFGVVVAVDDFSPQGALTYGPPKVDAQITNYDEVQAALVAISSALSQAKRTDMER